jgi:hypothetical protein
MELAPYCIAATGCQGINGPLPSTFLDKNMFKELLQSYWFMLGEQNIFWLIFFSQ